MYSLLSIGTQALTTNQTALGVTGQNISNVNTEGYTRQTPNITTRGDLPGVEVDGIQRIADQFLTRQLWSDISAFNRVESYAEMATQLDDLLADKSTSLSVSVDEFFAAMQNAVDDPTSLPNRELVLAEADALAKKFNLLEENITRQNQFVNSQISSIASEVTTISSNIANLNDKIRIAVAAGKPTSELRDQRDVLVNDLAEKIDIRVVEQENDEYSIFVGNGQPLVVGITYNEMVAQQGDPDPSQLDLAVNIAGNNAEITQNLSGGELGGLIEYRNSVLNPTINEVGRIAIVLSETINQQHKKGMDLENNLGQNLFADVNKGNVQDNRISADSKNASVVQQAGVSIEDITQLVASDYEVFINDTNEFTINRYSDGQRTTMGQLQQVATPEEVTDGTYFMQDDELVVQLDGIKISIDVTNRFVSGDSFLVQPFRSGAADIGVTLTEGEQLALATPIRINTSQSNTGTGVAEVTITDPETTAFFKEGELDPPIEVVFNNTDPLSYSVFDMSDPSNPTVLDLGYGPLENQEFTADKPIVIDGYEITIRNSPEPGDRFAFEYNTDGVSDSKNALLISNLQTQDLLDGGSYQDIYARLVERVGADTAVAIVDVEANRSVLKATENAKASVSGVNLDEEAARLVQFQQAYQASAQLIRAAQTIFDSLLNSV